MGSFSDADFQGAVEVHRHRGSRIPGWTSLAPSLREARQHIREEPEILVLSALQLAWTVAVYFAWAWTYAENSLLDFWLFEGIWNLAWLGVATLPLGILTLAMSASVVRRSQGLQSTFWSCLWLAMRRAPQAWLFQFVDGWVTLKRIMRRANGRSGDAETRLGQLLDQVPDGVWELLYQGWKAATAGIMPALAMGKSLDDAVDFSIHLLRNRASAVLSYRAAYALFCWCVAIPLILLVVLLPRYYLAPYGFAEGVSHSTHLLRFGFPLAVALIAIHIFARPIFVLACTRLAVGYEREWARERGLVSDVEE